MNQNLFTSVLAVVQKPSDGTQSMNMIIVIVIIIIIIVVAATIFNNKK